MEGFMAMCSVLLLLLFIIMETEGPKWFPRFWCKKTAANEKIKVYRTTSSTNSVYKPYDMLSRNQRKKAFFYSKNLVLDLETLQKEQIVRGGRQLIFEKKSGFSSSVKIEVLQEAAEKHLIVYADYWHGIFPLGGHKKFKRIYYKVEGIPNGPDDIFQLHAHLRTTDGQKDMCCNLLYRVRSNKYSISIECAQPACYSPHVGQNTRLCYSLGLIDGTLNRIRYKTCLRERDTPPGGSRSSSRTPTTTSSTRSRRQSSGHRPPDAPPTSSNSPRAPGHRASASPSRPESPRAPSMRGPTSSTRPGSQVPRSGSSGSRPSTSNSFYNLEQVKDISANKLMDKTNLGGKYIIREGRQLVFSENNAAYHDLNGALQSMMAIGVDHLTTYADYWHGGHGNSNKFISKHYRINEVMTLADSKVYQLVARIQMEGNPSFQICGNLILNSKYTKQNSYKVKCAQPALFQPQEDDNGRRRCFYLKIMQGARMGFRNCWKEVPAA